MADDRNLSIGSWQAHQSPSPAVQSGEGAFELEKAHGIEKGEMVAQTLPGLAAVF